MNLHTGREFSFTNPQDDPHLYAPPPPGFDYSYDGTLRAVPMSQSNFSQPFNFPSSQPSFGRSQPQPQHKLSLAEIRVVLQHGKFLPNARGPGKITFCDACGKRGLRQSIAHNSYDICLDCAQKYQ